MNVYLLANNVRSSYNVGSLFRLCDAVGVKKLFLTGFTPYPKMAGDKRPAYVAAKADQAIRKAGLEGVDAVSWEHSPEAAVVFNNLKTQGVAIVAIEQTVKSVNYQNFVPGIAGDVCFIVGHEREGVGDELLRLSDAVIEIPMRGKGKSLNVAMAATIVLFSLAEGEGFEPSIPLRENALSKRAP